MSISTWISRRIFSIFDSDRVFEEMDRMILEEKMLEYQEQEPEKVDTFTWIMSSAVIAIGGITVATVKMGRVETMNLKIPILGSGLVFVAGATVGLGYWWCQRKARAVRQIIVQLERTRAALKRRKQMYFSISMRMPRHRHPIILRACRIAVFAIECLVEKTRRLNNESTWQDLYTDEIREITTRSTENPEILKIEEIEDDDGEMDFEAVFETLIAVFKLHASEYSRVVIINLLDSSKFDFQKFRMFLQTCGCLQEFTNKLKSLENSALKSEKENWKDVEKHKIKSRTIIDIDIGWKQQTAMALEAILESLESETVSRSEIELALQKTLVMVGSEDKSTPKPESSVNTLSKPENVEQVETILIEKGKRERTDVDMVFEGVPLSEADKLAASKSAVARDVLLDGSESRRHEASLFGELQMVLEPRRNDFAKRERTALAKFYGVNENELEKEEKKEETFEGVGTGGDEESEPYDWRKDAEMSAGIHHDADNDDFLRALNLRRVDDDIIE